jgi:hypothetical protein
LVIRGDQPHFVPRGVIEALITAAGARGIIRLAGKLQVGGQVRMMAGPFADQLARPGASGSFSTFSAARVAISTEGTNVLPV